MQYVKVTELKKKTAETVEKAQVDTVVLTKHGEPVAVLMSVTQYRANQAMLILAEDPEALKRVNENYERVRRGDLSGYVDFDDTEKKKD